MDAWILERSGGLGFREEEMFVSADAAALSPAALLFLPPELALRRLLLMLLQLLVAAPRAPVT